MLYLSMALRCNSSSAKRTPRSPTKTATTKQNHTHTQDPSKVLVEALVCVRDCRLPCCQSCRANRVGPALCGVNCIGPVGYGFFRLMLDVPGPKKRNSCCQAIHFHLDRSLLVFKQTHATATLLSASCWKHL